jgi:hypothetical protein
MLLSQWITIRDPQSAVRGLAYRTDMTEHDIHGTRQYSREMFRSDYRIEVGCAIVTTDPPIVFVGGLAEVTGIKDNRVQKEVKALERLGLLTALPRPRGQQTQEYQVVPSAFWAFLGALAGELEANTVRLRL